MQIITIDDELIVVAVNSGIVMSNKCRPNWDSESKNIWSASRLRSACQCGEVASINGHNPEVRELMDLILLAESIIRK